MAKGGGRGGSWCGGTGGEDKDVSRLTNQPTKGESAEFPRGFCPFSVRIPSADFGDFSRFTADTPVSSI